MLRRATTAVISLAALVALAVPAAGQGLGIGAEVGVNFADFDVDAPGEVDTESVTGVRAGGVLRAGLGPVFGLQSGLYYAEKGTRTPIEDIPEAEFALSYFEVPLFLTVTIPTGPSPLTPRLYAGPQVAFETGCDLSATDGGTTISSDCDEADVFERESTEFSGAVGVGIDLDAGPGAFTVDARYVRGFTDLDSRQSDTDVKNTALAISAGYVIGF